MDMREVREPWVKIAREQLPDATLVLLTKSIPPREEALPPEWETDDPETLLDMGWNLHKNGPADGLFHEQWIAPQW